MRIPIRIRVYWILLEFFFLKINKWHICWQLALFLICNTGTYFAGAGGSHGAKGGLGRYSPDSNSHYDSIFAPEEFGEAGGCGMQRCENGDAPAGGGALHLQTTELYNSGTISARYMLQILKVTGIFLSRCFLFCIYHQQKFALLYYKNIELY